MTSSRRGSSQAHTSSGTDQTPPGDEQLGRRESHRRATRAAIQTAADRLINERGFEATTVREIADAAGVTERTFYRYFDGKNGLVDSEAELWMTRLHDAIVAQPTGETPLMAVRHATIAISREINDLSRSQLVWLFTDPAGAVQIMRGAGIKPLLRLESTIQDALVARGVENPSIAGLIARVSAAVIRAAASRWRQTRHEDGRDVPADVLLEEAFELLRSNLTAGDKKPQPQP